MSLIEWWKEVATQETFGRLLFLLVWSSSLSNLSSSSSCWAVLFWPCHHAVVLVWKRKLCVSLCCSSDEDMQSLASLMSMKQADIGNLDDFEEENEEDEENKVNQEEKAAKITGETRRCETHYWAAEFCACNLSLFAFPMIRQTDGRNLYLQSRFKDRLCCRPFDLFEIYIYYKFGKASLLLLNNSLICHNIEKEYKEAK